MYGYEAKESEELRVAVVGIGGAGCNIVSSFYDALCPVDTIAINTDKDALHATRADTKLYICREVLHGEGAQGDATIGRRCADIHMQEIREAVAGYDAVFVIAGLGGGTGTGAMPVVIDAAQSQGIMTFAVAINPFSLEGRRREVAREGWARIRAICENSILVNNDNVLGLMPDLTMGRAFGEVNISIRAHVMDSVGLLCSTIRNVRPRKVEAGSGKEAVSYPIESFVNA